MDETPDSSLHFSALAEALAKEENNYWALSKIAAYSGWAKENKDLATEAIIDYFQGLTWAAQSDTSDFFNNFVLARNIASIQGNYKNYSEAKTYYDSALHFLNLHLKTYPAQAKEYNDYELVQETLFFKALICRNQRDFKMAEVILRDLLEDDETTAEVRSNTIVQLGLTQRDLNDFEGARSYFQLAVDKAGRDSLKLWAGYHNLALIDFQQGRFEKALPLYQKATIMANTTSGSSHMRFITHADLGETLLRLGNKVKATDLLHQALSYLDTGTVNSDPTYYNVYQLLSQAAPNVEQAAYWTRKYARQMDFYVENQQQLTSAQARNALNLKLINYQASIRQQEKIRAIKREHLIERVLTILAALLTMFIAYKIFRILFRKWIHKKVDRISRKRSLNLPDHLH